MILLVLLGFAAAAVVFTLVFVVVVDPSVADTRAENEGERRRAGERKKLVEKEALCTV